MIQPVKLVYLGFLVLLIGPFRLFGAEDDIFVKVEVDKAFATIGDQINFRVTTRHNPDVQVLELDANGALTDFEIKKATNFSTREDHTIIEGKNYVITTYLLGEYVIKPFSIQYRTKEGAVKQIQTNSLYLTMESVDKNKKPESDIRGVKGVRKLRNPIYIWIFSFISAGLVGGGVWFYFYRKRLNLSEQRKEPPLSPHEEAYLALNQLKHSDLIRKGLVKQYFFQISEILRRYIERRFKIRALESTTYELMQDLKTVTNQENTQLIQDILTFCDLVKFAKYEPPQLEIIQQSNQAKVVIDKTKEEPGLIPQETAKAT